MVVRWASSSRAQWSQVVGHQLRFRGAKSPQIYFRTGCPTSRTRLYRIKFGPSLPVRRQLCCAGYDKMSSRATSSVNGNATNALNAAVLTANDSYIANTSISVYAAEARSENA
jgi:hypothetical protein